MNTTTTLQPGLTIGEVSSILKTDYMKARDWCLANNYQYRRWNHTGLTDEQLKKLLQDHSTSSLAEVGLLLGVSRQRAYQLYQKFKIPRTKRALAVHWSKNISLPSS